ncbi:MAG: succinylglutamate desuccinylase/aspartoacylase family protein [Planctomycetota bacterium]
MPEDRRYDRREREEGFPSGSDRSGPDRSGSDRSGSDRSGPSPSGAERRRAPVEAHPLRVEDYPAGSRSDLLLPLSQTGLGTPVQVPFVVLRGAHPGPVLGLCAAVHGNELNGINIIHQVLARTDPALLHGSLVCAPVVNVLAFEAEQRRFPVDDVDLNHVFPGRADGAPSQQYARAFATTFLPALDYLIDIHTASEGRLNSMYVRADLHSPAARDMAYLMNPEIILHGSSGDGTLRNAARQLEVPAITVEAGNPSVFQGRMALEGELGVANVMASLEMLRGGVSVETVREPVICKSSSWLRTRSGGLLETHFRLCEQVKKRQLLAEIRDVFGHVRRAFHAPQDGIVIGKSQSPVSVPGMRYCHLGLLGEPPAPRQQPRQGRLTGRLKDIRSLSEAGAEIPGEDEVDGFGPGDEEGWA